MLDLVGILEREELSHGLANIDSGVFKVLQKLSELVEDGREENESRLALYHTAVLEFWDGLDRGNYEAPNVSETSEVSPQVLGIETGNRVYSSTAEGQPKIQVESYQKFLGDLRRALGILNTELEDMVSAYQDPLAYLYANLPKAVSSHGYVGEAMVKILGAYGDLTGKLLNGSLEGEFIERFEAKSRKSFNEHMQLGIAYMFKGNMVDAAEHFKGRRRNGNNEHLIDAVRTLADHIHSSSLIFGLVYSKIQFARNFELYAPSK